MRIKIDDEDPVPTFRQGDADGLHGRRLGHAALLIGDGDDFEHHPSLGPPPEAGLGKFALSDAGSAVCGLFSIDVENEVTQGEIHVVDVVSPFGTLGIGNRVTRVTGVSAEGPGDCPGRTQPTVEGMAASGVRWAPPAGESVTAAKAASVGTRAGTTRTDRTTEPFDCPSP